MMEGSRPDAADVLARVGHHWGWLMAFGVITFLVGIAVLAWPGPTLIVVGPPRHANPRGPRHVRRPRRCP
jgi:uncharacterized membrane protein HdeD (DUF308 family)